MNINYKAAGVNKEAGYQQVHLIKEMMRSTYTDKVLSQAGGFSGMVALPSEGYEEPVLVSGTDGVGTKLLIAQGLDRHDTIGIDLVAMCVNDIVCQGADPLFFLDYIATGHLDPEKMAAIVSGVVTGCKEAQCSLIGGETAEMPGMYERDSYDLAGFAVGIVDRKNIITGERIQAGDVAIGLPSSGVHSNGFSLVRLILEKNDLSYSDPYPYSDQSIGEVLLTPTTLYAQTIQSLRQRVDIKGIAHITGGGLIENLPRILPDGLGVTVDTHKLPVLDIFAYLQDLGQVQREEMFATFNMGVGMVLVVSKDQVDSVLDQVEDAFVLGCVQAQDEGVCLL